MTTATLPDSAAGLRSKLRRAEMRQRLRAYALILPLFGFTLLTFLVPIAMMLFNSVNDPVVSGTLPRTTALLRAAPDSTAIPDEPVFAALAADMKEATEAQTASQVGSRINYERSGLRSLFMSTTRQIVNVEHGPWKPAFLEINPAWGEPKIWSVLRQTSHRYTADYYLHAVDLTRDDQGHIQREAADSRIYVDVFARTFWVSLLVTLLCLAIGYPLSFWLSHLPPKTANLMMVLVLLPFWTSLLVRTTAWVVLLQKEGVVNSLLLATGLIHAPLDLVFNRFGVVIAMTHILLPFMILPLVSVMRQIPPSYVRAARSLGASPLTAFVRVYLPQSVPGISAGVLLVFILSIGYYITPALVGGAEDQMMSYFIADHLTRSLNWGLASALGGLLLAGVLVLYTVYERYVGIANVRLG
ncbi:ABC transporter permease [Amphibiibacter pelophylacis]|uniref:ABC transporter permease n=1 Tax=Amphibiibacter pelophylacis TaxID=1799477 RepID=A0ACC6P4Z0_9BURK